MLHVTHRCGELTLPRALPRPYNTPMDRTPLKVPGALSPSVDNLRNLLLIRGIALLGQTAVLAYVVFSSRTTSSLAGVTISLALLALVTAASLWRTTRPWPVADHEFLGQLLIDVLGWTALMYFTGGANNPFISYYIVPVVIAAAVLPWRYTWLVAAACVLAYSLLLTVYQPFPLFTPHSAMGHGDSASASVHVLGMWFNFLFSVGLITYFVVRMAAILRRQEEQAVAQREDRLRNDQVMAVASLAAGTAHELGTPLATMTVLADEMLASDRLDAATREDCELMKSQIAQCKNTLAELSRTAELQGTQQNTLLTVEDFARQTLERWAVRRPGTVYRFQCADNSPQISVDPTLGQALENLLNNAADTGSADISMQVEWNQTEVAIHIRDHGPGIAPEMIERIGRPIIHADRNGLGIGLMLSQAAVERAGGRVALRNHKDGGAIATLSLPRAETTVNQDHA
ncbi:MAG: ATP-binding protein [Halioglobus sp.]